jgi:hypothetical protein
MTYGIKALRRIQMGREVTPGTIVAATTVWRGEGTIEDTRVIEFPVEDVGIIPILTRNYSPLLGAKLALSSTPATFEQLPHIFEMAVKLTTGGTSDTTGGSGYTYTYIMPRTSTEFMYIAPSTSGNPIKSYTIEGGDNNQAEVMNFSYVTDFELSFKSGEAVKISATLMGRQVALQAFTSSTITSIPTVFEILTSKGTIFVDSSTGTIGTTQITNEILSGSLKVKTGLVAIPTADGSLTFSFIKGTRPDVTLELTFEHSTFAIAEKVFWRSGTARQYRLKFAGNALTSTGASLYGTKALVIDLCGMYEKFSALEDQDGDDTITATFKAAYNATANLFAKFVVINELSAVP